MDPVTAALNLANTVVQAIMKVWDATPPEEQKAQASNYAKFFINIGNFIIALQERINAGVK